MQVSIMKALVFFALLALPSATVTEKDNTITKVVKLLQTMLDKSKKEGDEERTIYAKFKCYCDQSEATKNTNVAELTDTIEVLDSKIAEIQGDSGELSSEVADLKAKIADNDAAQSEATTLRGKENTNFEAEQTDLTTAIEQMREAIEVLGTVGADQTSGKSGADSKQFMAGKKSLLSVKAQVQDALKAASALMNADQRKSANAFVQGPFTGTYTSQSAQVMGIIKSMRDTFIANLADARTTEKNSLEAFDKFIKVKADARKEMSSSYDSKQKDLGDNDGELAAKKKQLSEAIKEKENDEEFLSKLLPLCSDKAAGYANRKLLRANEEAAIAEAVSILNSDDAFATFGTTSATSTGGSSAGKFIQLRSVHRHMSARDTVQSVLQKAAAETKSARLAKVVALVQAENAFTTVLGEIDKMIDVIAEEGKSDKEKLDWCNKERTESDASLVQRKKDILSLEKTIDKLEDLIENPKEGLKYQIESTELQLVQNTASQTEETKERTENNLSYQQDVKNLVSAQGILSKGLKALSTYYDDLEKKLAAGEALMQEDPAAGDAWKGGGAYAGQSDQGGDVIKMLEFILSESQKEEATAHADEEKAQADYEDSMTTLKSKEAASQKSLASLQEKLATSEKELIDAQEDLKTTTADKVSIEGYLEKVKPGCDFITTNFPQRETNRATEKAALDKAVGLIKATPAYKTAVNAATEESYGACKDVCVKDVAHVDCKSCQADVTKPAYCAGHKGTKGC